MRLIEKFDIGPGVNVLWLSPGAQVLKVAKDPAAHEVSLWALIDPKTTMKEERVFLVIPSGAEIPDEAADPAAWKFLDSIFMACGCPEKHASHELVFHMFEQLKIGPGLRKMMTIKHVGVA